MDMVQHSKELVSMQQHERHELRWLVPLQLEYHVPKAVIIHLEKVEVMEMLQQHILLQI